MRDQPRVRPLGSSIYRDPLGPTSGIGVVIYRDPGWVLPDYRIQLKPLSEVSNWVVLLPLDGVSMFRRWVLYTPKMGVFGPLDHDPRQGGNMTLWALATPLWLGPLPSRPIGPVWGLFGPPKWVHFGVQMGSFWVVHPNGFRRSRLGA